ATALRTAYCLPLSWLWLFHLQRQFHELRFVHRGRSPCKGIRLRCSLWESDYFSDAVAVVQHRDYSVYSEGDSAVGWGAVFEGVEEEAESFLSVDLADPYRVEHLPLDLGAVDTDGATAHLPAVPDHVVGAALPAPRVAVEVASGCGERVVHRVPARLVLVPLDHREVDDPEEIVALGGRRDLDPQAA